jgi:hypothetical protein
MTRRRRAALVAVLLVLSAAAVRPAHAAVPTAVPAAADDRLVLSVDGTTWTPDVTTPLLDPDLVWVPGDAVTGTLYARNVSEENATAAVTVHVDGGPDGAGDPLVEELDVRVRTGSGSWSDGPRSMITDLRPGEELPIGIRVELDPAATNASQLRTARLGVAVFLSATDPGEDGGSVPAAEGPDALPRTGANLLAHTIAAVAAVLAGSMLLLLRERRERRLDHGEAGP